MTTGQDHRDARAGMTLLELLLALSLMAAMAMTLAAVLGLTGKAALRIGEAGVSTDQLVARHAIREWIEAAPRTAAFLGSAETLRFVTLSDTPPFSAADAATVSLTRDAEGAVVAEIFGATDGAAVQRLTLSPAGALRLRYFGRLSSLAPPAWHEDWPAAAGLPDLVRIDYSGPKGDFPRLTVIPALVARQSEISLSSPLPPG